MTLKTEGECQYIPTSVTGIYMQGTLKAAVYGILNWQYTVYCKYTVLMAVYLQYILRHTESLLHFGLGGS